MQPRQEGQGGKLCDSALWQPVSEHGHRVQLRIQTSLSYQGVPHSVVAGQK